MDINMIARRMRLCCWTVVLLSGFFLNGLGAAPAPRQITFKNFCNVPVWISLTPTPIPGNTATCTKDADCKNSAPCINNQCVYPIPTPVGGNNSTAWGLAAYDPLNPDDPATMSTVDVTLQLSEPDTAKAGEVVYQYIANLGARTNCSVVQDNAVVEEMSCTTAQCVIDSTGGCISDMSNPYTSAQIILNNTDFDTYSLSFVHGINIPIGIMPTDRELPEPLAAQNNIFWCGHSGFSDARGQFFRQQFDADNLLGCNWAFALPTTPVNGNYASSVFYTLVDAANDQCFSDTDCLLTERCGFSIHDNTVNAQPRCGTLAAYTTMANVCSTVYNVGPALPKQAFGCYSEPGATNAFTMQSYALCAIPPDAPSGTTAPPSCYPDTGNPSPNCCGCIAWEQRLPFLIDRETCRVGDYAGQSPNFWQTNVRSNVEWLSSRCLAATAYQDDSDHATFSCSNQQTPTLNSPNTLGYTVTFCPDGQVLTDTMG